MLIAEAKRLHYSQADIVNLDFGSVAVSAAALSLEWKQMIESGKKLVDILPVENLGDCILKKDGSTLYTDSVEQLKHDLAVGNVMFHRGSIGGAWPEIAYQK